jgi:hypothetical protein
MSQIIGRLKTIIKYQTTREYGINSKFKLSKECLKNLMIRQEQMLFRNIIINMNLDDLKDYG